MEMANSSDATVQVKLPSIDELIENIGTGKLKIIMSGAAAVVAGEVRKRWARGIGASNESMDGEQPISKKWKEQKEMGGRPGKINYAYYGDFAQSFIPRNVSADGRTVTIQFAGDSKGIAYKRKDGKPSTAKAPEPVKNIKKARGLAYWRPKSFMPDDTLEVIGVKAFQKALRSVVKFTK
jgi:hypothetical protein